MTTNWGIGPRGPSVASGGLNQQTHHRNGRGRAFTRKVGQTTEGVRHKQGQDTHHKQIKK